MPTKETREPGRLSSYRRLINSYIITDMLKSPQQAFSLLDIGAGGCDIDLWLLKACSHKDIEVHITCLDNDPRIVAFAQEKTRNLKNINICLADALEVDQLGQRYDYVFVNHFLHHLKDSEITLLMKKINEITQRVFLINDLLRSKLSFLLFTGFAGLFFSRSFAYTDGRISIKKGFTVKEFHEIATSLHTNKNIRVGTAVPGNLYMAGISSS